MKKLLLLPIIFSLLFFSFTKAEYTQEEKSAYTWAFNKWITTMSTIDKADMNWEITRIALAKMISNYAIKSLKKKWDVSKKCVFTDVSSDLDKQYDNWVTNACQLWLMWQWISKFRPYDKVTRAEFWTILSRLLYWTRYDWWRTFYINHLNHLKLAKIMDKIADADKINEKRSNVMIMLKKSYDIENPTKEQCSKWIISQWNWYYEIHCDETVFYHKWYWISLKLWKEFKWWLIQEWTPYYNNHTLHFYVKDDSVKTSNWWIVWYREVFTIEIDNHEDWVVFDEAHLIWKNSWYDFFAYNANENDTNSYYSNLEISEFNYEEIWNNSCIEGNKSWLAHVEDNCLFYDIVRIDKDWTSWWTSNAFSVWDVHIPSIHFMDRRWYMYYTNNDTKWRVDFKCNATEWSDNNVSINPWKIEFVE